MSIKYLNVYFGYVYLAATVILIPLSYASNATEKLQLVNTNYSQWMANSIVSRNQGILTGTGDASELLQAGYMQKTFARLVTQYPAHESSSHFRRYIDRSVASTVPYISNTTRDLSYPLDRFSSGNVLFTAPGPSNASNQEALTALRQSLDLQRRNPIGGLWYYVYPEWSYLDGMYSLTPFYTLYTNTYEPSNATAYEDLFYQLDLLWDQCHDNATGLLVHGYDFSKTAVWANPVTGASPHVWSRSLGWYMMALVDTLEILSLECHPHQWQALRKKFRKLSKAVVNAVDPSTGAWWQMLDQPGREGNYIESSGTAMFVYALLKGHRLEYISEGKDVAVRAYGYAVNQFLVHNGTGTLGYSGTVGVCSLNSTASYEYYVTRPLIYNSVLGSASFILASLEYENLSH